MRSSAGGPAGGPGDDPGALRLGGPGDAAPAATMHARLIADGFLSSLGPRFLRRLYGRIVRTDGSFLLVAECDGAPIGFIAGSLSLGRLYRSFLVRDGAGAFLSAPVRLTTALPRVLETLRHSRGGPTTEGAELLAVAVDPAWRGRHVGQRLVAGFLHEVQHRGVTRAHVVVGAANAAAIGMYRQAGFEPVATFEMHRGTPSMVLETAVPARGTP
ncbi:MAG TPA: GNAT family N-acetyltransferase [Acidimicrobiales bacterium]|nr:GNAT family N-acetyltransferase [Acidimicrobiales bacterium]